ncbi:MAG: zinc ribbon domain-containing protein [Thermoplasmata archaeon]
MIGLTSTVIFGIVLVVIVCVVLIGVGLLLLQRLRQRRDQLRGELSHRPEAIGDRAFNRIAMARREANLLAAQGVPVPRARELVGEAQASFDAREFDRAYALAQSAHETLVAARQRPSTPSAADLGPATDHRPETRSPGPSVSPADVGVPPAPKIPPHRAEAQFQLRLLKEELPGVGGGRANDGRRLRAQALSTQAQQAFDRSDYAEAFRLALKGRREAGASVETLAPPPSPIGPAGTVAEGDPSAGAPSDPIQAATELASADRCPSCGHPTRPQDAFCRGCGVPRAGPKCPQCGAERLPSDAFCAKCGQPFASPQG